MSYLLVFSLYFCTVECILTEKYVQHFTFKTERIVKLYITRQKHRSYELNVKREDLRSLYHGLDMR